MIKKLLLALTIVLAIYALFFSPLFKIKNVTLSNNNSCIVPDKLLEETGLLGKNIHTQKKSSIEEAIKTKYSCTQDLSVSKKYPSTIGLDLKVDEPIAQLEGSDLYFTKNGLVVKFETDKKLPKIFAPEGVKIEENTNTGDKIKYALNLLENLQRSDFTPAQVRFVDQVDIVVYSQLEAHAIFTTQKDAAEQVDSLQSVLSKAKINPSKIEKIDLRFDKPTVTYKK